MLHAGKCKDSHGSAKSLNSQPCGKIIRFQFKPRALTELVHLYVEEGLIDSLIRSRVDDTAHERVCSDDSWTLIHTKIRSIELFLPSTNGPHLPDASRLSTYAAIANIFSSCNLLPTICTLTCDPSYISGSSVRIISTEFHANSSLFANLQSSCIC